MTQRTEAESKKQVGKQASRGSKKTQAKRARREQIMREVINRRQNLYRELAKH